MTPLVFFFLAQKNPTQSKYIHKTEIKHRDELRAVQIKLPLTWGFVYAVVVSNSSFLSFEGFVNGTDGVEDVDPVEQSLRQAIEEEKAK